VKIRAIIFTKKKPAFLINCAIGIFSFLLMLQIFARSSGKTKNDETVAGEFKKHTYPNIEFSTAREEETF
jgi:hypothetical protein